MHLINKVKKTVIVVVGVMLLSGVLPSKEAQAITVNSGDLLLAVFGNNNEYILNLGNVSSLLMPGMTTTFELPWGSEPNSLESSLSGANPIQWSIVGVDFDTAELYAASSSPATTTATPGIQNATNTAATWSQLLATTGSETDALVPAGNPLISFTGVFGTNTLAGSFSTNMQGGIGDMLYMISGTYETPSTLTDIGTAKLVLGNSLDLTVCGPNNNACAVSAVPLPASAALFATGLMSLVGMARHKIMKA